MNKAELDSSFLRNTFSISSAEFFWGIALPVIVESTFLQLFMRRLGASSFLIGLIPSLFFTGVALAGVLSGFFTSHLSKKKIAVMVTHLLGSVWMSVFGVFFLLIGERDSTLPVFFLCYGLLSFSMGLMAPVWQNFTVSLFNDRRVFQALAVMMIVQNVGKLFSSFIIAGVVERFAFSNKASAIIFIVVGLSCFIGSFFFLFAREALVKRNKPRVKRFRTHVKKSIRLISDFPNFRFYLISNIETYAVIGVLSFYANYATEFCGVTEAVAAGFFVAALYAGYFTVHVFLGWLDFLSIKGKIILGKICALLGIIMVLIFEETLFFILVSYIIGISRGVRVLTYTPAVKKLSGKRDATNFFAIAPLLLLPFSVGIPLLNGVLLDRFNQLPWGGYRLVFSIMGIICFGSLFFALRLRFPAASPVEEA